MAQSSSIVAYKTKFVI